MIITLRTRPWSIALFGVSWCMVAQSVAAQEIPRKVADLHRQIDELITANEVWEAERRVNKLLPLLKALLPDDAPEMCRQRARLAGTIYASQGRLTEAEKMLTPEVARLKKYDENKNADMDAIDYPQALYLLGSVQARIAPTSRALRTFDEVIKLLESRGLTRDIIMARAHKKKGLLLADLGEHLGARDELAKALESMSDDFPSPLPFRAATEQSLAATWIAEADELRRERRFVEASNRLTKADVHQKAAEKLCRSIKTPPPLFSRLVRLVERSRVVLDALRSAPASREAVEGAPWPSVELFLSNPESRTEDEALKLNSDAWTHVAAGAFQKADDAWTKALQVLEERKVRNAHFLKTLNVNQVYLRMMHLNKASEAAEQAAAAIDSCRAAFVEDLAFQSCREQQYQIARGSEILQAYLSAAVSAGRPPQEIYENVFKWKGILFQHKLRERLEVKVQSEYTQLARAATEAREVYTRCSDAVDATKADKEHYRNNWEKKKQALAVFLRERTQAKVADDTPGQLLECLDPDMVYVEFEPYLDCSKVNGGRNPEMAVLRYLAFVLRQGSPIAMISLPDSVAVLNDRIVRWRSMLAASERPIGRDDEVRALANKIADVVWRPIEEECREARLLWVCPTGVIWAFPFAAIPDEGSDYLVRRLPIGYAISGRQALQSLQTKGNRRGSTGKGVMVADIEYAGGRFGVREGLPVVEEFASRFGGPGVEKLTGKGADKELVLRAIRKSGQNVCFIGHYPLNKRLKDDAVFLRTATGRRPLRKEAEYLASDPFSFLIPLAGANVETDRDPIAPGEMDHWVSQDEMCEATPRAANRFELWACSGLLGPSDNTEGMVSFPRALLWAGYRTVLAGQWVVNQHAALPLVPEGFHEGIVDKELGDAEALRRAQCDAIDLGGANADPYNWAAWVIVGDPGIASVELPDIGSGPGFGVWWVVLLCLAVSILILAALLWCVLARLRQRKAQ